jgi:hypothetical protein
VQSSVQTFDDFCLEKAASVVLNSLIGFLGALARLIFLHLLMSSLGVFVGKRDLRISAELCNPHVLSPRLCSNKTKQKYNVLC